ncbi:MAG: MCP four helix bundle domain-containing protein [Oligoflexus sp.]|nr:MCP four helix bundle domain-containing protein [Oligoflexus sp.]
MKSRWTIGKRLTFLASINFIILLTVTFLFSLTIQKLSNQVLNIRQIQIPAIRAMSTTDMIHDGLRATVFRAFDGFYEKNAAEVKEAKEECQEFSKEMALQLKKIMDLDVSPQTKAEVVSAEGLVTQYTEDANAVIALLESDKAEEAQAAKLRFQTSFKALEEILGKLGDKIEKETSESLSAKSSSAKDIAIILATVTGIASILLSLLMGRSLIKNLREIIVKLEQQRDSLEKHTLSLDVSAESVSAAVEAQAAAIEETTAALDQINSMVRRTAENATTLASSSEESSRAVQSGRSAVVRVIKGMGNIRTANDQVASQVELSNKEMQGIVQMIHNIVDKTKVINDIVFQTKLLSFNASVEAARAGEHGNGFSVVAEEVGNLAQMSGSAALDIARLLEESVTMVTQIVSSSRQGISSLMNESLVKLSDGQSVADECDRDFELIATQVEEVRSRSGDISSGIGDQTRGLQEIGRAIEVFNRSVQENARAAKDTFEIAIGVREQFNALDLAMKELSTLIRSDSEIKSLQTA